MRSLICTGSTLSRVICPNLRSVRAWTNVRFYSQPLLKTEETEPLSSLPSVITDLPLTDFTLKALQSKGFEKLFPIQSHCFEPIVEGKDLLGRASKYIKVWIKLSNY
jgi:hypothetical protein